MNNSENNEVVEEKKAKKTNTPEYNKQYYEAHKEHILNNLMGTVITCPNCNSTVTKGHIKRHQNGSLCKRRTEKLNKNI